jgi:hypothetical protein
MADQEAITSYRAAKGLWLLAGIDRGDHKDMS